MITWQSDRSKSGRTFLTFDQLDVGDTVRLVEGDEQGEDSPDNPDHHIYIVARYGHGHDAKKIIVQLRGTENSTSYVSNTTPRKDRCWERVNLGISVREL